MMGDGPAGTVQDVQSILSEIRDRMGFVPPALEGLKHNYAALRVAWLAALAGYVDNPLPAVFKEEFLAVIATYHRNPYSLILRAATLRRLGVAAADIEQLLREPMPRQAAIVEQLRQLSTSWDHESGWAAMPPGLQRCILWALARITLRKDRGGRCRNALAEGLGPVIFDSLVLLATLAAMQRVWLDCSAEIDGISEGPIGAQYKALLKERPSIAEIWRVAAKRRRVTPREKRLIREVARLDRIREALHASEQRFRRVVTNAPFPVMIYTEDGRVQLVNRKWTSLCGWDKRSIPTIQKWIALAEVDRPDFSPDDLKALDGWDDVVDEGEYHVRTRTGDIRKWAFYTSSLGKLPDGRRAVVRMAEDVTERRELETTLWAGNRRLVNILESITDAFCSLDGKGRYRYVNARAEQILGCRREDVIGERPAAVTPAFCTPEVEQQLRKCALTGQTEHFEYYNESLAMHIEMSIYGANDGVSIYFRDISRRKQIERELRASEQRFRGLFDSDMLGIMFANRVTGQILDCNDALLKIIGYLREDVTAGRVNWISLTAPEYADDDARAAVEVKDHPLIPYKKEYIHKLGHRVPILIGGAPVNPNDDEVMAFVIDRTTERDAEVQQEQTRRMLEEVIRLTPVAIAILDRDGLIRLWNPECERVFGWTEQELLGKPNPTIPPEWREEHESLLKRFMNGDTQMESNPTVLHKSGRKLNLRVRGVPFKNTAGEIVGLISIVRVI